MCETLLSLFLLGPTGRHRQPHPNLRNTGSVTSCTEPSFTALLRRFMLMTLNAGDFVGVSSG
jgi:hypothetical protein